MSRRRKVGFVIAAVVAVSLVAFLAVPVPGDELPLKLLQGLKPDEVRLIDKPTSRHWYIEGRRRYFVFEEPYEAMLAKVEKELAEQGGWRRNDPKSTNPIAVFYLRAPGDEFNRLTIGVQDYLLPPTWRTRGTRIIVSSPSRRVHWPERAKLWVFERLGVGP